MKALIVTAVTLLTLLGCTDRRPPPGEGTYVIRNDGGGQLISAEADRARLFAWGGPVRIEGYCYSACVMFATLPNACLAPDLTLGLHGSNVNLGPVGNAQMARYMRGGVKERFLEEWQFIPFTAIHKFSVQEFVRLDPKARICNS